MADCDKKYLRKNICVVCGKEFYSSGNNKYCSKECRDKNKDNLYYVDIVPPEVKEINTWLDKLKVCCVLLKNFSSTIKRTYKEKLIDLIISLPNLVLYKFNDYLFKELDKLMDENLTKDEQICLCKAMYKATKVPILEPTNYFTPKEIDEYDMLVVIPEQQTKEMIFNVHKLNDESYSTYIDTDVLFDYFENHLTCYNKSIQRPCIETKYGKVIRQKLDVNRDKIEDIKTRLESENPDDIPIPTAITFTVLQKEGKQVQVYYDGDDNEGTLKIVPNYDIESPYYTPVCINDGFHRQTALIEEFVKQRKEGKDFNFRMILLINVINEYKAKRYTEDTFKASIPSKEVLNNFKPSTTNNFVDKIIENSKILKDRTVSNFSSVKGTNNLVSKDVLYKAIKLCDNLDMSNEIRVMQQSKKCAKIIDLFIGELCKEYFNNDLDKMKNNSFLLEQNMFCGYLAYCNLMINKTYIEDITIRIEQLAEICSNDEELEQIKNLRLNYKLADLTNVFNYFTKLFIKGE